MCLTSLTTGFDKKSSQSGDEIYKSISYTEKIINVTIKRRGIKKFKKKTVKKRVCI